MQLRTKRSGLFLVLILFCCAVSFKIYDVYASTTRPKLIAVSSWRTDSISGTAWGDGMRIRINDSVAYCIEPGVGIYSNRDYQKVSYSKTGLSKAKADRLALIAGYGYGYLGRVAGDWEAVTQGLIWHELGDDRYFLTDDINTIDKLRVLWNEILVDVDNYLLKPSFNNQKYEVVLGEEFRISDDNFVLNQMSIVSSLGVEAYIRNNQLIIKALDPSIDITTIKLKKNIPQNQGESLFWYHSNSQNIAVFSIDQEVFAEVTIEIARMGELELNKVDSFNDLIDGAVYLVSGNNYERKIAVSNGQVLLKDLEAGVYTVKEIEAPRGYLLDTNSYEVTIKPNEVTQLSLVNSEPTGTLKIKKQDNENGLPQGNATLEQAKYGLYAKEDIYNYSNKHLLYQANQLVGTLVTNENFEAQLDNIPMGKFILKEIMAPEGYLINQDNYEIEFSYFDNETKIILVDTIVEDQVIKRPVQLIKFSSNSSEVVEGLKNVEFEIKLKSEVEDYGWELAESYDILKTDIDGQALSIALPYGTYLIRELTTPNNLVPIDDFEVFINENKLEPLQYMINNVDFEAYLKLVKKDYKTNQTILLANTSFKIFDLDQQTYVSLKVGQDRIDTFVSNQEGIVVTPLKIGYGNYRIDEITAPEGYVINEVGVIFKSEYYQNIEFDADGDFIIVLDIYNNPVVGELLIKKEGEVLIDFRDGIFIYELKGLSQARFKVLADQDIYSSDQQGTLIYQKGEEVTEVITNQEGLAVVKDLPLGKYQVFEVEAPSGYIKDSRVFEVELSYINQTTEIIFEDITVYNEREKLDLSILKLDNETKLELSGAKFGIYSSEAIYNYQGELLLLEDQLITSVVTDENGKAIFPSDLPYQNYYIKELEPPKGYLIANKLVEINLESSNQQQIVFENQKTIVDISKVDATTLKELSGAKLAIKDSQGNIIEQWISTNLPYRVQGLIIDEIYTLIEIAAPFGFSIANEVQFIVEATNEIQKVEMIDELIVGEVTFIKEGEIFSEVNLIETPYGIIHEPVFKTVLIDDAEISIYALEDIILGNLVTYYEAGTLVENLSSEFNLNKNNGFTVGKYYAVETTVPYGFVQDNEIHYFEIINDGNLANQEIELKLFNQRPNIHLHLTKVLEENDFKSIDNSYEEVVFGIYAADDLFNNLNELLIEKDCLIGVSSIDETGNLLNKFDLPLGNYYIKELKTASGYRLLTDKWHFSISYQGKDVHDYHIYINDGHEIINELEKSTISILKVAQEDQANQLEGAVFTLLDQDYNELLLVTSDYQGYASIKNLPLGSYYLKETTAPNGYLLDEKYYPITLKEEDGLHLVITNGLYQGPLLNDQSNYLIELGVLVISTVLAILVILKQKKLLLDNTSNHKRS